MIIYFLPHCTDDSYLDIFQVLMFAIKGFIQKISWLAIFFVSLDKNLTVRCISNVIKSKNSQILLLNQISSQNSDDNGLFVPLRFDPVKVMTTIMKSDPAEMRVCVNISNTGGSVHCPGQCRVYSSIYLVQLVIKSSCTEHTSQHSTGYG